MRKTFMLYIVFTRIMHSMTNPTQRFCEDISIICRTPKNRTNEAYPYAHNACFYESFSTDLKLLDSSSRMWLHDIACDALRIITGYGSVMGYVFIDANTTTLTEKCWTQLLNICQRRPRCKKHQITNRQYK